jgi:hypothetical protein
LETTGGLGGLKITTTNFRPDKKELTLAFEVGPQVVASLESGSSSSAGGKGGASKGKGKGKGGEAEAQKHPQGVALTMPAISDCIVEQVLKAANVPKEQWEQIKSAVKPGVLDELMYLKNLSYAQGFTLGKETTRN